MLKNMITGVALVLLGVLGLLLDLNDLLQQQFALPEIVGQLATVIMFLLTTMGIRELMLQSKANILVKLVDIKSQTFWGTIITAVALIVANPEQYPNLPESVRTIFYVIGAIFVTLGWADAGKRGVFAAKRRSK